MLRSNLAKILTTGPLFWGGGGGVKIWGGGGGGGGGAQTNFGPPTQTFGEGGHGPPDPRFHHPCSLVGSFVCVSHGRCGKHRSLLQLDILLLAGF